MSQRAEQLVLDYLSEVGLALHGRLSPRERTEYLAGLRKRIDARRSALGDPGPEGVRDILRVFGSPQDCVRQACGGRALDLEDDDLIPPMPAHAVRVPPPWRGGPNNGLMRLLDGPGGGNARPHRAQRHGGLRGLSLTLRTHTSEAVALGLMLLAVPWGLGLTFLWVLSAALVVLSRVWGTADKWIGVGLPLAACAVAMLLWNGEAKFIDVYIARSLPATGVIGIGLGSLVCVFHLYPKALRSAQEHI
ncbi:HAAS signaling domain-containing protein [Nocardiopsis sp. CNT312]|uniref:HAAS signaling domain-containing protein n=1 Tax=Nocardiopsis sp. CNT312 TaxID=1137268 RepID=UPI00048F2A31|nr:hypothetical protein [Nocardiopsis sp. CNT312]